jgi:hypothetical protein
MELSEKMKDAYKTVMDFQRRKSLGEGESLEAVQRAIAGHEETLQRLSTQTVECAIFLAECAAHQNFSELYRICTASGWLTGYSVLRGVTEVLSGADASIATFTKTFDDLQRKFADESLTGIEGMEMRGLQDHQDISACIYVLHQAWL